MGKPRVIMTGEGRKFFVKDTYKDFHTQFGYIKSSDLAGKEGAKILSNTNVEFSIFPPYFIDLYQRLKRDAQIIPLKDIGAIVAETGINKKSRIVEGGSGSGALACFLANIAKEVVSYDIREDFIEVVKRNIELLGLKNLKIKKQDIYEGIEEKNVDAVMLDLPEPWKALDSSSKSLKAGGFLVSYSPTIIQVSDLVNAFKRKKDFAHIKTIEIIEREWEVDQRKVRPKSRMIGHSGFLTFLRRI